MNVNYFSVIFGTFPGSLYGTSGSIEFHGTLRMVANTGTRTKLETLGATCYMWISSENAGGRRGNRIGSGREDGSGSLSPRAVGRAGPVTREPRESVMAGSVNKVILVGNLGKDPEIRRTQDGRPIANLS